MIVRRIIAFFLGIFVVVCGAYCIVMPESAYLALSWVLGFVVIIDSFIQLYTWDHLRMLNFWNKWEIIGALFSLIIGIVLICSFGVRETFARFIGEILYYTFATWLVLSGIVRTVTSFKLREFHLEFATEKLGTKWWLITIIGILMILVGMFLFLFPVFGDLQIGTIGKLIGVGIIVAGLNTSLYSILY